MGTGVITSTLGKGKGLAVTVVILGTILRVRTTKMDVRVAMLLANLSARKGNFWTKVAMRIGMADTLTYA
jgi:hypothetical protein